MNFHNNLLLSVLKWFSEPFAKELAEGDDERLANHIEERIYQHLMRQTEIGVASEEALDVPGEISREESDDGKFIQGLLKIWTGYFLNYKQMKWPNRGGWR